MQSVTIGPKPGVIDKSDTKTGVKRKRSITDDEALNQALDNDLSKRNVRRRIKEQTSELNHQRLCLFKL